VFPACWGVGQEMYTAPEVVVSASETDAAFTDPEGGLAAQAAVLPGVVLDAQGGPGGQGDLRIRGGAFSGAGLSVNGLSLGNAQTEHFNAELPLAATLFDEPFVLTGVEQALQAEGHLNGTVSLRLRPMAFCTEGEAGIGAYESGWLRGCTAQRVMTSASGGRLGVAAFGGYDSFNHVNDEDNDNEGVLGGGQVQWLRGDVQADAVAGYREKSFGARGYYGVHPDYPADEKTKDFLLLGSLRQGTEEKYTEGSAAYRDFNDEYRLDLPTSLYHNEHCTRTMSAQVGGRKPFSDWAGGVWRLSADQEELTSESLGDHRRSHAALTLIPEVRLKAWCFAAGVRQEWFEREEPAMLPQVSVQWEGVYGQLVEMAYSQTVRQPSYTELNYESPASLGQEGLDNQFADTLELHWKLARDVWSLEIGPFARETRDTVDWVRPTEASTRWLAENVGTVRALGADGSAVWMVREDLRLRADGMWMSQSDNADIYASRYALDYMRVLVRVHAQWQVTHRVDCAFSQGYRLQAENPMRGHGDEQWLAALRLGVRLPGCRDVRLVLSVENLWDDDFEEFPGQATATGRRVYAGVTAVF
ncbi:MAG: TonB-dependent receptor, partial [Kiritimatiellae bacterium]|nr:TonB-dependent receptor [Kiritimatiellia bacterium]